MALASEAIGAGTPLSASLDAGLEALSGSQTVTFTQYVKLILPLDGFVFWVRADLVGQSAALNAAGVGNALLGHGPKVSTPAPTITARGSLHFASQKVQDETESYGLSQVTFTSETPLDQNFNKVGPDLIYIGEFGSLKFAFSNRQNFYRQAGLFHYVGDAIYPFMQSQIIDKIEGLNTRSLVVSNSLPFWLALNNYAPFYGFGNTIPLYPSSLTPPNVRPPFGSVHISPETTQAIASAPFLAPGSSHYQLVGETVRIVFYGVNNDAAMIFLDCVNQYSVDYGHFGISNIPTIRDEKVGQNELGVLAMKKNVEFEINYHHKSARDVARQIICQAIPTITEVWPSTWVDPYPAQ